jgi:hypothetical protein
LIFNDLSFESGVDAGMPSATRFTVSDWYHISAAPKSLHMRAGAAKGSRIRERITTLRLRGSRIFKGLGMVFVLLADECGSKHLPPRWDSEGSHDQ